MSGAPVSIARRLGGYVALTKPRVIELLLVTTVPVMVVAEASQPGHGALPSLWLILATVIGGSMAAGGANAVNMVVDRDIDAVMDRTRDRPLVTGVMTPQAALTFAVALEVAAFLWLWGFVNLLSAVLALSATAFYVFVYTLWLKRSTSQNIVIGGAAGCVPVLIGWSAVTGTLDWAPVVLFLIVFLWTPPHTWALAFKYRDDYSRADVPMLPSVAEARSVGRQSLAYTVALVAASLVLAPVAGLGALYLVAAAASGALFTWYAVAMLREPSARTSIRLFTFSITYVTVLFGAMALDRLVAVGL
jgi:protoheme IX farnesyltransferase